MSILPLINQLTINGNPIQLKLITDLTSAKLNKILTTHHKLSWKTLKVWDFSVTTESTYKLLKNPNFCTKIKYTTATSQVNAPLKQFRSKSTETLSTTMIATHTYSTETSNFTPTKSLATTEALDKNCRWTPMDKSSETDADSSHKFAMVHKHQEKHSLRYLFGRKCSSGSILISPSLCHLPQFHSDRDTSIFS